jgi:hypothetical protein
MERKPGIMANKTGGVLMMDNRQKWGRKAEGDSPIFVDAKIGTVPKKSTVPEKSPPGFIRYMESAYCGVDLNCFLGIN